jgi:hypothetical protein
MNKSIILSLAVILIAGSAFLAGRVPQAEAKDPSLLEFDAMVGLPPAFTGTQNPIREVNGGGLPWAIRSASGDLKASGKLEIDVRGLVFADGPDKGSNTVPSFRAIVSCLKSDGTTENVMTDPFPATVGRGPRGGGNAEIKARLSLPKPCIAPIIFVTSPTGAWFAVTGK